MEEGEGPGCLAPSRQYGNALLGVRHQEEEELSKSKSYSDSALSKVLYVSANYCAISQIS